MTTKSNQKENHMTTTHLCQCNAELKTVDSRQYKEFSSITACCIQCGRYSLITGCDYRIVIPLRDFHLKRGDGPNLRPLSDMTMATRFVHDLMCDKWPTPAASTDFGITSLRHYRAFQIASLFGIFAYEADRIIGDGRAITKLVDFVLDFPVRVIKFTTPYDDFFAL